MAGHEGYITVGLYDDGRPGELFITMAKEGSTIGGLMDCFGTAVSMSLQYGVPLEVYVNKFSHTRFEPMGHTKNPDIRIAKSIVDYIFRWLGITFLPGYREAMLSHPAAKESPARAPTTAMLTAETPLAATKAGERNAGPGPAAKANGAAPGAQERQPQDFARRRHAVGTGRRHEGRSQRRTAFATGPNSSPASRPMPPVATTAARLPSATAIAIFATTAATAWVARKGLPGRMPASNPKRFQRASSWFRGDARFFMKDEGGRMKDERKSTRALISCVCHPVILRLQPSFTRSIRGQRSAHSHASHRRRRRSARVALV